MADDSIPAEVRDFISRYIDTVAKLEALLLLRADPGHFWDVEEMAKRLYASERETAIALDQLHKDGFLNAKGRTYHFGCQDTLLLAKIDHVARVHATRLIPLTNMIHAKFKGVREFADAFKFRKGR